MKKSTKLIGIYALLLVVACLTIIALSLTRSSEVRARYDTFYRDLAQTRVRVVVADQPCKVHVWNEPREDSLQQITIYDSPQDGSLRIVGDTLFLSGQVEGTLILPFAEVFIRDHVKQELPFNPNSYFE